MRKLSARCRNVMVLIYGVKSKLGDGVRNILTAAAKKGEKPRLIQHLSEKCLPWYLGTQET